MVVRKKKKERKGVERIELNEMSSVVPRLHSGQMASFFEIVARSFGLSGCVVGAVLMIVSSGAFCNDTSTAILPVRFTFFRPVPVRILQFGPVPVRILRFGGTGLMVQAHIFMVLVRTSQTRCEPVVVRKGVQ